MSDSLQPHGLQHARQDGIISFLWFKTESKLLHVEDHVLPTSKLCGFTLLLNYFIFLGSKITADGDWSREIKRHLLLGRKVMTNLDSILKQKHYFTDISPYNQSYGFSSSHAWMWEMHHKKSWVPKNWCFWTVVVEKSFESALDCKEI